MSTAKPGLPLVLLLAGLLGGCASGPPPGRPDGPAPPRRPDLFISPAGEAFRAPPGGPYPVAAWFAGADADHDGRLTPAEFAADAQRFARSLDRNGDGVIDGFELGDYERSLPEMSSRLDRGRTADAQGPGDLPEAAGRGPGGRQGPGGGGPRRGRRPGGGQGGGAMGRGATARGAGLGGGFQGAAAYGLLADPQPVAASDRDLDGRVTLEEAQWAAERRFAALDRNHDGVLDLAELPRTPAQAAAQRGSGRGADGRRNEGAPPLNPTRRRPGA